MQKWIVGACLLLSGMGCARGDYILPGAATTSPESTSPDGQALPPQSSSDEILDALDARGQSLKDFVADVTRANSENATGDTTSDSGSVTLQRLPNGDARVRVSFTKQQKGNGKAIKVDHQYTLADGTLVDRDYLRKKEIIRHVLKPGQKIDLFKLGQGPFPLPLGQKRADVLKLFDVKKIDPAAGDPPQTIHLQLIPKDGTAFARDFASIDLWIDLKSKMPVRIQTVDANNTTTITTDLSNVQINTGVGDKDFAQPALPEGTDSIDEPFRG